MKYFYEDIECYDEWQPIYTQQVCLHKCAWDIDMTIFSLVTIDFIRIVSVVEEVNVIDDNWRKIFKRIQINLYYKLNYIITVVNCIGLAV